MSENTPGWQVDPTGRFEHRYWDGSKWTDNVSNAGVASTDAYTPDPAAGSDAGGTNDDPTQAAPGWGDPTTTHPAPPTDPTAAWPAMPTAPPVPPSAALGGAAAVASAGSKKGLLIGGAVLGAVAIAAAAIAMGGGGGNDDRDRIRAEMAAQFASSGELSKDQAECISDAIIEDIGVDRLKDVDISADEPPPEIADDIVSSALANLQVCDISSNSIFGSGDPTDTTDTTSSSDGGGTFGTGGDMPAGFEQQLADIYENSMGLSQEKAECLAGKIADAISSGDLTQDEAMTEIFGYFSKCNIDMSEITGN